MYFFCDILFSYFLFLIVLFSLVLFAVGVLSIWSVCSRYTGVGGRGQGAREQDFTLPENIFCCIQALTAKAAAMLASLQRLWPAPWPTPTMASYSQRKQAFKGLSLWLSPAPSSSLFAGADSKVALKPVGKTKFLSTWNPSSDRKEVSKSWARNSLWGNSGLDHISLDRLFNLSLFPSIVCKTTSFQLSAILSSSSGLHAVFLIAGLLLQRLARPKCQVEILVQIENKFKEIQVVGIYSYKIKFLFSLVVRSGEGDKTRVQITGLHNSIMELHSSIYRAPLISNYAVLFELWSSIKLTHQILCHAIDFNQAARIFKSAKRPLRSRVLWLTEVSSLSLNSLWTSPRNETVKPSRDQMIMASYAME